MFAINKFHRFIWGRPFVLITDNFAVQRILGDTRGLPTRTGHRLQHWAAILQGYNYKLIHKKSDFLKVADALSRLPNLRCKIADVFHVKVLTLLPVTSAVVAAETAKDKLLSQVLTCARIGWHRKYPNPDLDHFARLRDDITIVDGCLMFNARVIIPPSLQSCVLKLIHDGHPGMVRSKALARSLIYWPSLNSDIETMVRNCDSCCLVNFPVTKMYLQWPPTTTPFQRVHIDFFDFQSRTFFLFVDSYSKWLHVSIMTRTTALEVNSVLMSIFAMFGLPGTLVSDNGPPFDSNEYADFCTSYNITLLHSPVYHPSSNGLAERNVDIAKKGLRKILANESITSSELSVVLNKFLFNYRNTPNTVTGKAPNEMLFSFKPQTLLTRLLPVNQSSHKNHYRDNELVYVKLHKKFSPVQGRVLRAIGADRYLISVEGVIKEAHHNHLSRSLTL